MKREIEILAPAGSMESLKAAIVAGADAVYTGGSMFGARAYANNLSEEELLEAIDFVHLHGKKIFLTVNTLLKEKELEAKLYEFLLPYYKQGLDAVIVQDIGVLKFIRTYFPDLPIHASTQMTITGVEGAKFLEKQGVQRVVTARELSLCEVKEIAKETNVEIESFVHGALCYCYSGQCLFSSFLGGRSGNRGQCAQPCRLLYQAEDEKRSQYLLSLKDICTLELIPELVEAGIYSFKIEGRMKKPEYVAAVSYAYRKYTDMYLKLCEEKGSEEAKRCFKVTEQDKEMLLDLYNRGGFHTGYYKTRNGQEMVSLTRPNHAGVPAIKVEKKQGRIVCGKALTDLYAQDIIELPGRRGQEKADTFTCKHDVRKGKEVQISVFADTPFQKGEIWNRTRNAKLIEKIQENFVNFKNTEKLKGKFMLFEGEPAKLVVSCRGREVSVCGAVVQKAQNQPMDMGRIEKQLRKTGNTEFEFEDIQIEMNGKVFLPMQSINEIRREALDAIEKEIVSSYRRQETFTREVFLKKNRKKEQLEFQFTASAQTREQVLILADTELIHRIYIDVTAFPQIWKENDAEKMISYVQEHGKEIYLIMPYIFRKDSVKRYDEGYEKIFCHKWDGILIRNYESFEFLMEHGFSGKVMTDHNLYQFNQYGRQFWEEQNINEFTLPLELTSQELKELGAENAELIVYGHLPMMVSAGCVKKTLGKCKKESGQMTITDRYRKKFVVKNECDYCYNVIYNQVPLYLGDLQEEIRNLGPKSVRLMFTTEGAEKIKEILRLFHKNDVFSDGDFTRGHWKKGIK